MRAARALLSGRSDQRLKRTYQYLRASKSKSRRAQFRQDLFVLSELDFKRSGYFVEIGATDGVWCSNTCLLERDYGWTGILCEPARSWHASLHRNRSANIETHCLWSESGSSLDFVELPATGHSTVAAFSQADYLAQARQGGAVYAVPTLSLQDLLVKYRAPRQIDYLSVDTEGSEYEILKNLDFNQYSFQVITCEHNHTPMRQKLYELFTGHGYVRKFEELSQVDDWYVHGRQS